MIKGMTHHYFMLLFTRFLLLQSVIQKGSSGASMFFTLKLFVQDLKNILQEIKR